MKGLKIDGDIKTGKKYVQTAENYFQVWLSLDGIAAKSVKDYLNFQHQIAWGLTGAR